MLKLHDKRKGDGMQLTMRTMGVRTGQKHQLGHVSKRWCIVETDVIFYTSDASCHLEHITYVPQCEAFMEKTHVGEEISTARRRPTHQPDCHLIAAALKMSPFPWEDTFCGGPARPYAVALNT